MSLRFWNAPSKRRSFYARVVSGQIPVTHEFGVHAVDPVEPFFVGHRHAGRRNNVLQIFQRHSAFLQDQRISVRDGGKFLCRKNFVRKHFFIIVDINARNLADQQDTFLNFYGPNVPDRSRLAACRNRLWPAGIF